MLSLLLAAALARPDIGVIGSDDVVLPFPDALEAAVNSALPSGFTPSVVVAALASATLEDHDTDRPTATTILLGVSLDALVLAERADILGLPASDARAQASLAAGAALADDAAGSPAIVVLVAPGRRDGAPTLDPAYTDFAAMQARITSGALALADALDDDGHAVSLAPVGPAFAAVAARDADPLAAGAGFRGLYTADGFGLAAPGTALQSLVVAATLTGRLPTATPPGVPANVLATLGEVVGEVVFDDALGAWGFPWAYSGEDWPGKSAGTVGGRASRPVVALSTPLTRADFRIGVEVDGAPGDGRVDLLAGGGLTLAGDGVIVGDAGDGELHVRGGRLETPGVLLGGAATAQGLLRVRAGQAVAATIARGQGTGRVRVEGGLLQVSTLQAPITHEGGTLRLDADATVEVPYTLGPDATLVLPSPTGAPTFTDAVTLQGVVEVPAGLAAGDVLLRAPAITLDGADIVGVGQAVTVEAQGTDPVALTVTAVEDLPDPDTDADPDDTDAPLDDITPPPSGCQCDGVGGAGPGAALLALLAVAARRRR
jgi:hypothetical protein